jgi:TonB family protein
MRFLSQKITDLNLEKYAFLIALFVHMSILASMFLEINKAPKVTPVLSFSISTVDIASSPSNISTSSASKNNKDKEKKEPVKNKLEGSLAPEEITKKTPDTEKNIKKTDAENSTNSIQQTAVFAPQTPTNFSAAYLQNPVPAYPSLSKRLGEEGKVILNVYINKEGEVKEINIAKSSGFERLDKSAVKTVKKWHFIAAKKGDKFVASEVQIPINFVLEKNE